MSNYLNFSLNPKAAFAYDKGTSYVIGEHTRPDPDMKPFTTFTVDSIMGDTTSRLGEFATLKEAQAAAQADANA